MAMSDRIAVLNGGELQQVDSPQTIYNTPANTFVADFTGAENIFEVSLVDRSGRTGTVRLGEVEFETQLSEAVAAGDADEYRLVLRPEEVSVSDGEGRVSGTVSELVYKGALTDVNVEVDIGTDSVVFRAEVHSEDAAGLTVGDTVVLDWPVDSPLMVTA